jgi:hypothetical protein
MSTFTEQACEIFRGRRRAATEDNGAFPQFLGPVTMWISTSTDFPNAYKDVGGSSTLRHFATPDGKPLLSTAVRLIPSQLWSSLPYTTLRILGPNVWTRRGKETSVLQRIVLFGRSRRFGRQSGAT